jgi:hypothetical protein
MYGNGNSGFGGDWGSWIILFLIFGMFNGGWGGFGGMNGMGYDFPWLLNGQSNTNNLVSDGFQNAQISNQLTGIQGAVTSGFGDVQTALCGGFAGVNATVNGAQNALTQQLYTNQIADLERSFAAQTANTQGMNALQGQLAQCCCENRAATADLKYTIATEACNTRAANTANTQAILDKLCQLELDGYKRENDNLRQQLNMSQLAASQAAQTATFQQGLNNEVDALYNRLKNCPVGTVPVFGNQPIFTCAQNVAGGCGCNGNAFYN